MDKLVKEKQIMELLHNMIENDAAAGANLLIYEKGKETGYFEAGYADILNRRKIQRDTIFHLYSMSKPILSAAVMILIQEGKLDLWDQVDTFLPTFHNQYYYQDGIKYPVQRPMAIRDLLSMTSGLVYGGMQSPAEQEVECMFQDIIHKMGTEQAYSTRDVADKLGSLTLDFSPGTHWKYGTSADILGAIIEVVTGKTLGEYLQEELFVPLGMTDTGFYVPVDKRNRMSCVYEETDQGLQEYHHNHLGISIDMDCYPAFESGGAGLVSTIDDYMNFASMLLDNGVFHGNRILNEETVHFMTNGSLPQNLQDDLASWTGLEGYSYANLMRIMKDESKASLIGSNGEYGWDGWLGCYFVNDPKHHRTILYMQQKTNTGTTGYTRKLRNIIMSE